MVRQFYNQIAFGDDKSFIIAQANQRQQAASFIKQISIVHLFHLGVQQSSGEMEERTGNNRVGRCKYTNKPAVLRILLLVVLDVCALLYVVQFRKQKKKLIKTTAQERMKNTA